MKVLFLVTVIAVCLMIFAPATEAANYPRYRTGRLICCQYSYKPDCGNSGYRQDCSKKKLVCLRYCSFLNQGYH